MVYFNIFDSRPVSPDKCPFWAKLIADGDFDVHTWIDWELSDLTNSLGWRLKINNTLVDSHLVSVPGLGTFTIWSLTGGNSQCLGWHTDWTLKYKLDWTESAKIQMERNAGVKKPYEGWKIINETYLDFQVLVTCSLDEFIWDSFDGGTVLRSDGDSDFVFLFAFGLNIFTFLFVSSHFWSSCRLSLKYRGWILDQRWARRVRAI